MTDMDYRDMAHEIRALVPLLVHPQAVVDLRSLADRYERLSRYFEALSGTPPHLLSTGAKGAEQLTA